MVSATIYITSKIYELWRWEILKHYLEDWIGNDSTIQKTDILYRFQRFVTNHSKNIQFLNGDTSWRLKLVPTIKKNLKSLVLLWCLVFYCHFTAALFSTIQNPDVSGFCIPSVNWSTLCILIKIL